MHLSIPFRNKEFRAKCNHRQIFFQILDMKDNKIYSTPYFKHPCQTEAPWSIKQSINASGVSSKHSIRHINETQRSNEDQQLKSSNTYISGRKLIYLKSMFWIFWCGAEIVTLQYKQLTLDCMQTSYSLFCISTYTDGVMNSSYRWKNNVCRMW